jgi:urease accessory protein
MDSAQLLPLLHLADSAFPSGAFAHSYGLEAYTQAGVVHDAQSLFDYMTGRVRDEMARFDLVLLAAAMDSDPHALLDLDDLMTAMLTVQEARDASMTVGRRFLKSAGPLYGGERTAAYRSAIEDGDASGHFVLGYGVIAADLDVTPEAALTTYTQMFVNGQAQAAVKLINLGQTRAGQVIRQLGPVVHEAARLALSLTLDDLHQFAPALDIHSMQHEYAFRRLFIS